MWNSDLLFVWWRMTAVVSDLGRVTDPALLILVSLAEGPKHGYAMLEDISILAGVRLGPGTLYTALTRLEARGLVAPLPPVDRRRPYCLTDAGATYLREQLTVLGTVLAASRQRLAAR